MSDTMDSCSFTSMVWLFFQPWCSTAMSNYQNVTWQRSTHFKMMLQIDTNMGILLLTSLIKWLSGKPANLQSQDVPHPWSQGCFPWRYRSARCIDRGASALPKRSSGDHPAVVSVKSMFLVEVWWSGVGCVLLKELPSASFSKNFQVRPSQRTSKYFLGATLLTSQSYNLLLYCLWRPSKKSFVQLPLTSGIHTFAAKTLLGANSP